MLPWRTLERQSAKDKANADDDPSLGKVSAWSRQRALCRRFDRVFGIQTQADHFSRLTEGNAGYILDYSFEYIVLVWNALSS